MKAKLTDIEDAICRELYRQDTNVKNLAWVVGVLTVGFTVLVITLI